MKWGLLPLGKFADTSPRTIGGNDYLNISGCFDRRYIVISL
jgi:hypothetical protein